MDSINFSLNARNTTFQEKRSQTQSSIPPQQRGKEGRSEDSDIKPFQLWEPRGSLPMSMQPQAEEASSQSQHGGGGTLARPAGSFCHPCSRPGYESFHPNLQNDLPARSRTIIRKEMPLKNQRLGNNRWPAVLTHLGFV